MLWWTLRKLRSKDPRRRREAVTELANSRDSDSMDHVLNVLYDADWEVRRRAVDVLAKSQTPRALQAVGRILTSASEKLQTRQYAATALASSGSDAATEILSSALIDHSWDLRKTIVDLLEKSGWSPTTSPHRALTAVVHFNYGAAVAEGEAAFEPLTRQLEQHAGVNQPPILDALSRIGGERASDYFISILPSLSEGIITRGTNRWDSYNQGRVERVRRVLAAESTAGGQHAADYLVAVCTDPSLEEVFGFEVATYLGHRRFECAVPGLCEKLTDDTLSLAQRCRLAEGLGKIGDLRAVDPLKEFIANLRTGVPSIGVGQNDPARGGLYLDYAQRLSRRCPADA